MSWEVTIRHADGAPLGDLASFRQQITDALPAIQFHREPSGFLDVEDLFLDVEHRPGGWSLRIA
jgi:hypothetical protein